MNPLVREVDVVAGKVRLLLGWWRLVGDGTLHAAELFLGPPAVVCWPGLARPPLHRVPLADGLVSLGRKVFVLLLEPREDGALVREDAVLMGQLGSCCPYPRILLASPPTQKAPSRWLRRLKGATGQRAVDKVRAASGLGAGIALRHNLPVPHLLPDDGLSSPNLGQQLGIGLIPPVDVLEMLADQARGLSLF